MIEKILTNDRQKIIKTEMKEHGEKGLINKT